MTISLQQGFPALLFVLSRARVHERKFAVLDQYHLVPATQFLRSIICADAPCLRRCRCSV